MTVPKALAEITRLRLTATADELGILEEHERLLLSMLPSSRWP
jgi:hypothetical protein